MLNGPDLSAEIENITESVCPSDTSSDSGCPDERVRTLASPGLDDERYSPGGYFDTGSCIISGATHTCCLSGPDKNKKIKRYCIFN